MPVSAVDLTWSYAALLTAADARAGLTPAAWGAAGLTVPSTCSTGGGSNPGGGGSVSVTFNVQATTTFGGRSHSTRADFAGKSHDWFDRKHFFDRLDQRVS